MAYVFADMELTPAERMDSALSCGPSSLDQGPKFPYGLRIYLTEKELAKLKLTTEGEEVGGYVHGHFMAKVTSITRDDNADGVDERVELQIEMLCIESEDDENYEADRAAGKDE